MEALTRFKALQWGVSQLFSFFSAAKYPIAGYSLHEKEMNGARMLYVRVTLSPGTPAPTAFVFCINKYGVTTAHIALTSTAHLHHPMIQSNSSLFDSIVCRSSFLRKQSSLKIFHPILWEYSATQSQFV